MMNTWDETAEKPFLLQIVAGLSQFFFGSSYKMVNITCKACNLANAPYY